MSSLPSSRPLAPEPTWAVAHLFPPQGEWTENEFFALHGNRLIELVDGNLEVLPIPTWLHQLIVKFLVRAVESASGGFGEVLDAPLPIRLFEQNIREPDVMYFPKSCSSVRRGNEMPGQRRSGFDPAYFIHLKIKSVPL